MGALPEWVGIFGHLAAIVTVVYFFVQYISKQNEKILDYLTSKDEQTKSLATEGHDAVKQISEAVHQNTIAIVNLRTAIDANTKATELSIRVSKNEA